MHCIGFYFHIPADVHGQARAPEPPAPERAGPPPRRSRACDIPKPRTARRQPPAATGRPAASSPLPPPAPRPRNLSSTPLAYPPIRSPPPTTYRAVISPTSRTPVSLPRHHHPLARVTRTALPSPRHRPAHSTSRAAESHHSRPPASVTARHGHTSFHVSQLSPILALSCAFKIFKNKSTIWRISEPVPPITPSNPHPTRSYAARICVSSSSEAQPPRFKPSAQEKYPSFTQLDLTNAQRTAMRPKHMR